MSFLPEEDLWKKPRELANRWPNNHLSAVKTAVGPILLVYSCLSTERDFRVYNYFAIFPNLSIRGQAQSPTSVNTLPVLCYWNKLPVSLRQLTTSYQSLYSLYNCRLPTPFTLSCSVDLTLHRPNALLSLFHLPFAQILHGLLPLPFSSEHIDFYAPSHILSAAPVTFCFRRVRPPVCACIRTCVPGWMRSPTGLLSSTSSFLVSPLLFLFFFWFRAQHSLNWQTVSFWVSARNYTVYRIVLPLPVTPACYFSECNRVLLSRV